MSSFNLTAAKTCKNRLYNSTSRSGIADSSDKTKKYDISSNTT